MCPKKVAIFTTGDWIRKARYIVARQLGRCLTEREQVFHKNKDSLDDSLENLELVTLKSKPEKTEEQTRKTIAYKFGYSEGYDAGWDEGYQEREKK